MAYKRKSPLKNAYSNAGSGAYSASKTYGVDTSMENAMVGVNANGTTGVQPTEKLELDPDKLEKEGESDNFYPELQKKYDNAKNAKRQQKIQNKINRKSLRHTSQADRNQMADDVKRAKQKDRLTGKEEAQRKKQSQKAKDLGLSPDKIDKFNNSKRLTMERKSPVKYLNPNTMNVQGDAGQNEETNDMNMTVNRAGRPVNSNVLMNDPNMYQDPSKIAASSANQNTMFSNIASSSPSPDMINPQTGMMDNQQSDPNQLNKTPFNLKNPKNEKTENSQDELIKRFRDKVVDPYVKENPPKNKSKNLSREELQKAISTIGPKDK